MLNDDGRLDARWGWVAALHCEVSSGPWVRPGQAAQIVGVSAEMLRWWAMRGLITSVYRPRRHRWYFGPELEVVVDIGGAVGTTTTQLLDAHVRSVLMFGVCGFCDWPYE
ncbi:MerR family DNA-binding transcriptional regulator [Spirillospora sp. NPDC048911]|uniref:MerR family transcriptional regulator n=1 Tax=Spirillospora sp. NPDC048911 TaxID=3364527 RepID=UPI00371F9B4C